MRESSDVCKLKPAQLAIFQNLILLINTGSINSVPLFYVYSDKQRHLPSLLPLHIARVCVCACVCACARTCVLFFVILSNRVLLLLMLPLYGLHLISFFDFLEQIRTHDLFPSMFYFQMTDLPWESLETDEIIDISRNRQTNKNSKAYRYMERNRKKENPDFLCGILSQIISQYFSHLQLLNRVLGLCPNVVHAGCTATLCRYTCQVLQTSRCQLATDLCHYLVFVTHTEMIVNCSRTLRKCGH